MATLQHYQRRGFATQLLVQGLRIADAYGKKWYAACYEEAVPLYEKPQWHFKYVIKDSIDLKRYGGEGVSTMKLYIREPESLPYRKQ